jgi:NifU-like protein involved in Fe-S cluster formation
MLPQRAWRDRVLAPAPGWLYAGAMLDDVYNRRLLSLAANIPRIGRLDAPDGTATVRSRLCGSTVTVDVRIEGNAISDYAQEVRACALGQASAALLARDVIGCTVAELEDLLATVQRLLRENGPAPEGKWAGIEALTPVREVRARHASTLLPFEAVVQAARMAEAARAPSRIAG